MSELEDAVRAVIRDCLAVREDEAVLLICNPATQGIAERPRQEAHDAGGDASRGDRGDAG